MQSPQIIGLRPEATTNTQVQAVAEYTVVVVVQVDLAVKVVLGVVLASYQVWTMAYQAPAGMYTC